MSRTKNFWTQVPHANLVINVERSEFPSGVRDCPRRRPPREGFRWRLVTLNRVPGGAGSTFELPALLLVDGDKVTSAASDLAKVKVTAEILEDLRGPKIVIQKFKNKTGYKKRQGHRQELTKVKITGIK